MAEPSGRRALGRGLAALLGETGVAAPGLVEIAVDEIRPNPNQPRRSLDPAALEALAASIRTSGLVQPVVVRRVEEGFELIAGERRWRAARAAGLARVPALVREADERERLELALVENVVREDLNPIEVARALAVLIEDFGQTHAALAERLGRSRPAVSNLVRLLELPDDVQQMVASGQLSEGHARAILQLEGAAARRRLAERIVRDELSVRQAEDLARAGARDAGRRRRRPPNPLEDWAVDVFYGSLGAAARAREARGGEIVVELRFPDRPALEAALERLHGLAPPDDGP